MSTPVRKSTPSKSPAAASSTGKKGKSTPDVRLLPQGQYEVTKTPVKAIVGGDVAVLDFVATVVQMCPSDMEHESIRPDSCVMLRFVDGSDRGRDVLGIGRAWPQRTMKPGRVRLGWQLFSLNQSEFEEKTSVIAVLPLEGCECGVPRSIPVAKQIWLRQSLSSEFASLSVDDAPATSSSDFSLSFVMTAAAKRLLRGVTLVDGCSVVVRVRGVPTVLTVSSHSLPTPVATQTSSMLYSVGPDTVVAIATGTAEVSTVTAPAVGASVHGQDPAITADTAQTIGGMQAQVTTIQRMLHLPLRSPETFTKLGLQPYRCVCRAFGFPPQT
jgi:hypothetical protein